MKVRYSIDPNIETQLSIEQVLSIIDTYKKKCNLDLDGTLKSIQLNPQFDVHGTVAWIVGECWLLFGEERDYFYIVSDKIGLVEYTMNEHGIWYPHLEKEKTPEEIAQEKADDEAYLQELRDAGIDVLD